MICIVPKDVQHCTRMLNSSVRYLFVSVYEILKFQELQNLVSCENSQQQLTNVHDSISCHMLCMQGVDHLNSAIYKGY